MSDRLITLAPGGSSQEQLLFWAQAARVDNPGGQWIRFPIANLWCPPYTTGYVVAFETPTSIVAIDTVPPPGQTNTGQGAAAQITLTDEPLSASPGSPLAPNLTPTGGATQAQFFSTLQGNNTGTLQLIYPNSIPAGKWLLSQLTFGLMTWAPAAGAQPNYLVQVSASNAAQTATQVLYMSAGGPGQGGGSPTITPTAHSFTPARPLELDNPVLTQFIFTFQTGSFFSTGAMGLMGLAYLYPVTT